MAPTSKLTAKGQTTIPREVRERRSLQPGDMLSYEIDDEGVRLRTVEPVDVGYLRAVRTTLSEWEPSEDAAYDDL